MGKRPLLLGLLLLLSQFLIAQGKCATTAAAMRMEALRPGYLEHVARLHTGAQQWTAQRAGAGAQARWTTATIPVVVHIVYNAPAENISDAQVQSQIDVLNEDFGRYNADTADTRAIFQSVAANTHIQFCLAARDPQGNATTGITRTQTGATGFSFDDRVKFDTSGGKDAWDPAHYLNIWVCNLTTANGYAYYPNIQPAYDGVVVNYNVFGRIGAVVPPYDRGRTTTHEVGHWLGLYHPFEGFFAGTGCLGSDPANCASAGDRICDTPGDITPSYGCNPTENSCVDTPVDLPDQIENYMDYADDDCCNMFSQGQADRMNGFLYTVRRSLLTSLGCVVPGSSAMDVAAVAILRPVGQTCDNTVAPLVTIGNVSAQALTSLDITYTVNGGAPVVTNWSGSLAAGAQTNVSLSVGSNVVSGINSLDVIVSNPNAQADANPVNDTVATQFEYVAVPPTLPIGMVEDFESGTFPAAGWRLDNPDQNYYAWELSSDANGSTFPGSNAIMINNFYLGSDGTRDALVTPVWHGIDDLVLFFDYAYMEPASSFYSDTLRVSVSHDCGDTWTIVHEAGGSLLATVPNQGFAAFVPAANQWNQTNIVFGPSGNFYDWQFKFENISGWGNDLWLDNISLTYTVATDPDAVAAALVLSPNPAQDVLRVHLDGRDFGGGECTVVTPLGQVVQRHAVAAGTVELLLDVSGLSTGVYWVRYAPVGGGNVGRWFLRG